jgi:hypothetical protein
VTKGGLIGASSSQNEWRTLPSGSRDRDIDLLLLTGAGASCGFGAQGQSLPLMADWAKDIFSRLQKEAPGCIGVTGLTANMSGPEFERQLGSFLRQRDAFSKIEPLIEPSFNLNGVPSEAATIGGGVRAWYKATDSQLDRVLEVIAGSLYKLFGAPSVDLGVAKEAYSRLLSALGLVPRRSRLVVATTNYDTIAEWALGEIGWLPDWGEMPPRPFGSAPVPIQVDSILNGIPRYVPVLHLHGSVGWYLKNGEVLPNRATTYNSDFGTPVVVYPDPDKAYDGDPVIAGLWAQFGFALDRAKRVLILGHSLNDRGILREVRQRVLPQSRVGISILTDASDRSQFDSSSSGLMDLVRTQLAEAKIFPLRFGGDFDPDATEFRKWLEDTEDLNLSATPAARAELTEKGS